MNKACRDADRQDESSPAYALPQSAILIAHPVILGLSDLARTAWCRIYMRAHPYEGCRMINKRDFERAIGIIHLTPGHALTVQVIGELIEAALLVEWRDGAWLVHDGPSSQDALLFAELLAETG